MIPITETSSPPRVSAVSETFVVSSKKTPSEILAELYALGTAGSFADRVTVRLSGSQFIIARRDLVPNPFARSIFGVVKDASSGSIIDYSFSVNPAVRIIFSMWFALMTVALITGIGAIMTSGINEFRLELVVLPIIFMSFALGMVALCLIASRKGERELEQRLHGIIGDTKIIETSVVESIIV